MASGVSSSVGGGPKKFSLPEFKAPQIDDRRVSELASKIATPQTSKLRRQFRLATRQPYDNPAARAFSMRRGLAGFGEGLSNINTGARSAALNELRPGFNAELQASLMDRQFEMGQLGKDADEARNANPDADLLRQFGGIIPEGAGVELTKRLYAAGARPASDRNVRTNFTSVNRLPFSGEAIGTTRPKDKRTYNLDAANAELEQLFNPTAGTLSGADLGGAFSRLRDTGEPLSLLEENTRRL